ncbi:hypothetical protein DICPUDRAFT_25438 [Dictyostelium purpureum]|uniref:EGF-like domain-containing protein n=1 Tax=Dictyostelium purpureum TaxID=5786 RepID=F0Z6Y1_DICPU|nr:uncharacterized protein DICPUDRAFT_25438 [Dictyostelium purpureum]EGC40233.1 hypothetical protein DICPUDRAFT_25438 [Dictyostelium purpureum]|eukprot:XP_003283169.1 hypothetical protein DICPUDRAFT_25438 [Dictyostelium purpureum]
MIQAQCKYKQHYKSYQNYTKIFFRYFNCPFISPTSIIDLSNLGSTNTLSIITPDRKFHLNGELPLILGNKLKTLILNGSYLKQINYRIFDSLTSLYLTNNTISGTLPPLNPDTSLLYIDLNNNEITGNIDRSYCNLKKLVLTNNKISGEIPTCFTCFFNILKNDFNGNYFSNYDPLPCTTTIPYNMTYKVEADVYTFIIDGYDLGGDNLNSFVTFSGENMELISMAVLKPNSQISLKASLTDSNKFAPQIISITYSVYLNSLTFKLPLNPSPPRPNTVLWFGKDVTIIGSYFTYDKTTVSIMIGKEPCIVSSTTFDKITCSVSIVDTKHSNIKTFINVGSYSTQISLNPEQENIIILCAYPCMDNAYCNTEIGQCICDEGFQGNDCQTPYLECQLAIDNNQICGNRGKCNNQTGICVCDDVLNPSPSCSSCPDPLCGGNGKCNYSTATCECKKGFYGYQGPNCAVPSIYVASVDPSSEDGGNALFSGWFGLKSESTQTKVFIGGKECTPISLINETTIICTAQAGTGLQSVNITNPSIYWFNPSIYKYQPSSTKCLNDCNEKNKGGVCNKMTGYCLCNENFDGADCSKINNNNQPPTNTTVDDDTGLINLNNQKTKYNISIISLIEVGIGGNIVSSIDLKNKWSNITTTRTPDGNLLYNFTQSIQSNQSTIIYLVEEVEKSKIFTFAGIDFKVSSGSIKITVLISNYQFTSNLNTLKLLLESSVENIDNPDNECNDKTIDINSANNENGSSSNLNYITIKKDAKILTGRFLDRAEADDRSTFITSEIANKTDQSLTIAINLPHCVKYCKLDPDFSVLVSNEFRDECPSSKKWLIPVAVAVPVVGVSLIVIAVIILYRNRLSRLNLAIKLKNLGKK